MTERLSAETLALDGFLWLAGDDDLMGLFLAASGAPADGLSAAIRDPVFLGAVLDFILAEDARVIAFCDARGLRYTEPMAARMALPGGGEVHWT